MIKEIKKEFKKMFSLLLAEEIANADVVEELNEDEVKISDKAVGAKAERINADGTLSPLEDGKYVLGTGENPFEFEVKDGVISAIINEDGSVEQPTEEAMADENTDAPNADLAKEVEDLKAEVEALKEEIKAMKGDAKAEDDSVQEMKKEFQKLNATLEAFAKIPAQETKINEREEVKKNKEDKLNKFVSAFAKK